MFLCENGLKCSHLSESWTAFFFFKNNNFYKQTDFYKVTPLAILCSECIFACAHYKYPPLWPQFPHHLFIHYLFKDVYNLNLMYSWGSLWEPQHSFRSQTWKHETTHSSVTCVHLCWWRTRHCDWNIRTMWQIGRSKRFWTFKSTLSGPADEGFTVGICVCVRACVCHSVWEENWLHVYVVIN